MNKINTEITKIGVFLGGMRCGSTAINDYLKTHPEICMYKKKDPHFFSGNKEWENGWDSYLSGWDTFDSNKHKIAFESSTHYTKLPLYKDTAKRMASAPFDMRLIYGVRPPLERIESHLVHNAGKGYFNPENQEERRKIFLQAVQVSDYQLQISRFEKYFSITQIKIVETKSLITQPQTELSKICNFLGVDDTFQFSLIKRRPRIFKNDITKFELTDLEREEASSLLYDHIKLFEKNYKVSIWDGVE
jgi:hypothetical protein